MATSSANRQPLLVDRPLHAFTVLGGTAALSVATNLNTIVGGGCVQLVDCGSNDGAVIDSISVIANEVGLTSTTLLVLLSTATSEFSINTSNTACVAAGAVLSSSLGQRTNISLPPLSVPVPNLAGPAATTTTYPSETDKKNTGLYIPSGSYLYVGITAAITAPSPASRINVFAQGGFF